uniref:FXYD domain-containing ion transport regulator n=1 Tax=Gouania willdenowi TaxID=441366 RepID=A0A8C5GI02_GOUWI
MCCWQLLLLFTVCVLSRQSCQVKHRKKKGNMSSLKGADIDPDADFVYDYHTLRVGGLAFAGIIVFLSIILLAGNKIRNCGKSKPRQVANDV